MNVKCNAHVPNVMSCSLLFFKQTTDLNNKEDEPSQETELGSKGMDDFYVFQTYITAGGHFCIMLGLMLIFCLAQLIASGGDYWLTYW